MAFHPFKIITGRPWEGPYPEKGAIDRRLYNIRAIWNNEYDNDSGIEKLIRLFLAVSQFFFPGLYIKEIFSRKLIAYQDIAVDVYVLLKLLYPFVLLMFGLEQNDFLFTLLIWLFLETILYVPTLVFASDVIARPRSYRRSILLLFINYTEIIFDFEVIYAHCEYLNTKFAHWFDPIYFSFITSATIGYGDYYPVQTMGKFMVSFQTTLFIVFIALFLNFYSGKVVSKGYFGQDKP